MRPEEEQPILGAGQVLRNVDRSTERVAPDIVAIAGALDAGGVVEKVIRVQSFVSVVLVDAAVKILGAGLQDDVDGGSGVAAILGLVIGEEDVDFGNGIQT